jgi:hypothetical protein
MITEKERAKIETIVRLILGQRDFGAIINEDERPEHLRFDMGGNRDDDEGENANVEIWKKFYPFFGHKLSIRRSYGDERPILTEYVFTFHKGGGCLNETLYDKDNDEEVMSYYGEGTVKILTDLIERFCPEYYDFTYELTKTMSEKLILDAEYITKFGVQTIKDYC